MTSSVLYQGKNFWVVNKLPWYVGGIHQCICTDIKENGAGEQVYYPVQYNWVEKMVFIGREIIGVEYLNIERELDHWAFGPHHLWSEPETGNILRMWQPFNGLQVYPGGVPQGSVDSTLFDEMSDVLNGWLNTSTLTKPCMDWDVTELQQLQ